MNLGVRPEDLTPADEGWLYQGEVAITEALGEVTLLYFQPEDPAAKIGVIAKLPGIHPDLKHRTVGLRAAPEKIHLFANGRSLLYR